MLSAGLTFQSSVGSQQAAGLVGPNTVIQLAEAMRSYPGLGERVFAKAGCLRFYSRPPDAMIDEAVPARLFHILWREVPAVLAEQIAYQAGKLTGEYVLVNRIPRLIQLLLRTLPPSLSCLLLLKAIRKHAWTFAGSGQCLVHSGHPAVVTILNNPLAVPGGVWHVGVFHVLFSRLVSSETIVHYRHIRSKNGPSCRFEVNFSNTRAKDQTQ